MQKDKPYYSSVLSGAPYVCLTGNILTPLTALLNGLGQMHRVDPRVQPLHPGLSPRSCILSPSTYTVLLSSQEILRANENVNIAADLVTKYRKNVQYNLEAMRDLEGEEERAAIS